MLKNLSATLPQYVMPQHGLSRLLARFVRVSNNRIKNWSIRKFIDRYQVDMSEAVESEIDAYVNFNQFFIRKLKPELRPIVSGEQEIASPVDGVVKHLGKIEPETTIRAKGFDFDVDALLGGKTRAKAFHSGQFATLYLSPRHYHRVHMPIAGRLKQMVYIPGKLFSVNPKIVHAIPDVFSRNERVVCIFDTEYGEMAMVLVGAMLVAGIHTPWQGDITPSKHNEVQVWDYAEPICLEKGEEMGYFNFGSTVILLFNSPACGWHDKLQIDSDVKMGQLLGLFHATSKQEK